MPLPRLRLTVRRLMLLVALLGALLGAGIEARRLYRLSLEHTEMAEWFRQRGLPQWELGLKSTHEEWLAQIRAIKELNSENRERGETRFWYASPPPPEVCRVMVDHYRALEAKYRRAARYPWLAVEPDPPTPRPTWTEPE